MRMVENWCSDEEKPLVFHVWFPKATTTLKQKVPSVQMALKNWQSNQNKLYWFGGYHPSTKHFFSAALSVFSLTGTFFSLLLQFFKRLPLQL